jgi:hypothetical protein
MKIHEIQVINNPGYYYNTDIRLLNYDIPNKILVCLYHEEKHIVTMANYKNVKL